MLIKYKIKLENDSEWTELFLNDETMESSPEAAIILFMKDHPEWYLKYLNEYGEHNIKIELISDTDEYFLFNVNISLLYDIIRLNKIN